MKKFVIQIVILLAIPVALYAGNDLTSKTPFEVQNIREKAQQPSETIQPSVVFHSTVKIIKPPTTTFNVVYSGSLKNNIERLAKQYGWDQVVWNAPSDYTWVGNTRINATTLPGVLNQLLADFPLQAVFYQGNHVLEIIPRTIQQ